MRYLDAKKKLIFMLATSKYIRLITGENKMSIDDELFTNIAKSIQLVFPEYSIRTEDVAEIIGGIKSILACAEEHSKVTDFTLIEAKRRGDVNIDSTVFIQDLVAFQQAMSNRFKIDEAQVFSDLITLNTIRGTYLKVDDLFQTFSAIEFNRTVSAISEIIESIGIKDVIEIRNATTGYLSIDSKFVLKDNLEIEVSDLVPIPLEINEISYLFDGIKLDSVPIRTIVSKNKTDLRDKVEISVNKSPNISSQTVLSFKECLAVSKYRYSLLEDYDDFDIGNIKDNFKMLDLIYIEQ